MNAGLYAGFARIDVTPMLGIDLEGYYVKRTAKGILDKLEINALAISDGTEKAILISTDQCMLGNRCSGSVPAENFRSNGNQRKRNIYSRYTYAYGSTVKGLIGS